MRDRYYDNGPSIKERSMTAISVILLFGLFAAAGAVMAYYFLRNPDLLFQQSKNATPVKTAVHLKFRDMEFFIPKYLLLKVDRSALRKIKKIRLAVPQNWTPDHHASAFTAASDPADWVFATISKSHHHLSNRERLATIYRLYIAGPAIGHSSGLFRYHFRQDTPYYGTELFTDDLQKPTFFIRCELQSSSLGARLCSRQVQISARLTLQYRFARSQISNWQKIHKTITTLVKATGRRSGL
jgi:hypothetical protein